MRWISEALTCDDVVSGTLRSPIASGRGMKEGLERHDVCEGRVSAYRDHKGTRGGRTRVLVLPAELLAVDVAELRNAEFPFSRADAFARRDAGPPTIMEPKL